MDRLLAKVAEKQSAAAVARIIDQAINNMARCHPGAKIASPDLRRFQEWNVHRGDDPSVFSCHLVGCSGLATEAFRRRDRAKPTTTDPAKAAAGCRRAKLLKEDTRSSMLRSRSED